jgi:hypothetical protein
MVKSRSVVLVLGVTLVLCSFLALAPHGHTNTGTSGSDCALCHLARTPVLASAASLVLATLIDVGRFPDASEIRRCSRPKPASCPRGPPV